MSPCFLLGCCTGIRQASKSEVLFCRYVESDGKLVLFLAQLNDTFSVLPPQFMPTVFDTDTFEPDLCVVDHPHFFVLLSGHVLRALQGFLVRRDKKDIFSTKCYLQRKLKPNIT